LSIADCRLPISKRTPWLSFNRKSAIGNWQFTEPSLTVYNEPTRQPRIQWLLTCKRENVRGLISTLKKIFFWNYARNTWQWDLLCVVILIFIFLTPNWWFKNSELPSNMVHQSPVAATVVLSPEVVENEADKVQIEQRVKDLTGRTRVEVVAVRKVVDSDGRTRSFEVDIR
jgi:hypothetical protein